MLILVSILLLALVVFVGGRAEGCLLLFDLGDEVISVGVLAVLVEVF